MPVCLMIHFVIAPALAPVSLQKSFQHDKMVFARRTGDDGNAGLLRRIIGMMSVYRVLLLVGSVLLLIQTKIWIGMKSNDDINNSLSQSNIDRTFTESTATSITVGTTTTTTNTLQKASPPPPEPLETMSFCAEKCAYIKEMCSNNLHRDKLSLPAPTCVVHSTTGEQDIYLSNNYGKEKEASKLRNKKTVELVHWAAARARERRLGNVDNGSTTRRCEDVPTLYDAPIMFPDEFEFVVKVMANLQPTTYLEWGTGASTSFYPLLASGDVFAIDGYPPWCEKVEKEPRVQCMIEEERRLQFYCPTLVGADGKTKLDMKIYGLLPKDMPDEDMESALSIYVNSIDKVNVTSLDVALVDGRFRFQCALKLLPLLHDESIVFMHDFWMREPYHEVLHHFDVIGYARNIVALRKKPNLPEEKELYKKFMKREQIQRVDIFWG
jgi:hypothetical protein